MVLQLFFIEPIHLTHILTTFLHTEMPSTIFLYIYITSDVNNTSIKIHSEPQFQRNRTRDTYTYFITTFFSSLFFFLFYINTQFRITFAINYRVFFFLCFVRGLWSFAHFLILCRKKKSYFFSAKKKIDWLF